jgi:hypothetical protein
MQTFRKLPNTSPNRKNAAAKNQVLAAKSKIVRTSAPLMEVVARDYTQRDLVNG